jgi:hypothetical protein
MVGERLSVGKCVMRKFATERFNFEFGNSVEIKEQVQVWKFSTVAKVLEGISDHSYCELKSKPGMW